MSKKKKEQEVAHENVNSPGYRIGFNSKVFSAMKKYISIMMILACVAIHAKNKNDFNAWLSLMEEISNDNLSRLNSASLDERVETERYGQFLPQADETCPCDTESIWWLRGGIQACWRNCSGHIAKGMFRLSRRNAKIPSGESCHRFCTSHLFPKRRTLGAQGYRASWGSIFLTSAIPSRRQHFHLRTRETD